MTINDQEYRVVLVLQESLQEFNEPFDVNFSLTVKKFMEPFALMVAKEGCSQKPKEKDTNMDLKDWLQVVSTLAVTGGFIYAALQFRGWRLAQYVGNLTKLVELQLQVRKMVVDDPSFAPVGLSLHRDSSSDEMRSYHYNLMQLSLFENAWFAHTHGQLPDDCFALWEVNMSALSSRPSFRDIWQSDQTKILHDGFRQYMDGLIKTR